MRFVSLLLASLLPAFVTSESHVEDPHEEHEEAMEHVVGSIRPEGIHILPPGAGEDIGLGAGDFALVSEM